MNARLGMVLAFLAVLPVRPLAAELTKVRGRSYAIVVSEKVSEADAFAAVKQLREHAPIVELGASFPQSVPSEQVDGFTPGVRLTVLGYCKSRDDANAAASFIASGVPHVLIREAAAEQGPGTCPTIRKLKRASWQGFKVKDERIVRQNWLSWASLTRGTAECSDAGLLVQQGKRVLAERQYKSDRCEPNVHVAYAVQPLEFGGRTFWLVTKHEELVDSGGGAATLVGIACGDLRDVYRTAWTGLEVPRFESMHTDDWTGLRVTNGDGWDLLHWDEASCEFKVVQSHVDQP